MLTDFPKLHCPFIRKTFSIHVDDFKAYRNLYNLRQPNVYLAVNEVNPDYEWVFEDKDTFAVEKLDGSNVKLRTEMGRLVELQNRKNVIDPLQIVKGRQFIIEGVLNSAGKGMINKDGEQAGELIGPKVQGNPYQLTSHLWFPFDKALKQLRYNSFDKYERTFVNWSDWFETFLVSRFAAKRQIKDVMAEGLVFYNLKRKAEGKTYRAKLRRDMFVWFYSQIDVIGYGN